MYSIMPKKRNKKPKGATHYDCLKMKYYQTTGVFSNTTLVWVMGHWVKSKSVTGSMLQFNKERFESVW